MGKTKTKERPERNLSVKLAEDLARIDAWSWADDTEEVVRPRATPRVTEPPEVTVPRGAQWLDIMSPSWFRRLPFDAVDIQSVQGCPLCNAFPDEFGRPSFDVGVRRVCRPQPVVDVQSSLSNSSHRPSLPRYRGADTDQLAHFGFLPFRDTSLSDPYSILNALWRVEILKRLERSLSS